MNFFHIESLPHSLATMHLLVFLFFIAKTLFIAYLAAMIGGISMSFYYRRNYLKSHVSDYLNFSSDFFGKLNNNLLTPFGLGIAPLFAIVFIYIQFSSNPNNSIISSFILTTILFPLGLILNKIDFKLLSKLSSSDSKEKAPGLILPFVSLLLFLLVAFFFCGADISFMTGMGNIGNVGIFGASLSYNGIFSFLSIVFLGFVVAIVNFLTFEFDKYSTINSNESRKEIYENMIEIFLFSAGAFIILTFLRNALMNYLVFTPAFATVFILMIFFAVATTYFLKFQKSLFGFSSKHLVYVSFILFLLSFGGSDSFLFLKASENNIAISVEEYNAEFAELKSHSAKKETKVNAEDLFFDKCVSCHSFDKNGVGPAFNQVIPKYKGKKDDLKNFLLSPVKVDPNYPQMPNQGLKPAEAKALAEYLFQELGIK